MDPSGHSRLQLFYHDDANAELNLPALYDPISEAPRPLRPLPALTRVGRFGPYQGRPVRCKQCRQSNSVCKGHPALACEGCNEKHVYCDRTEDNDAQMLAAPHVPFHAAAAPPPLPTAAPPLFNNAAPPPVYNAAVHPPVNVAAPPLVQVAANAIPNMPASSASEKSDHSAAQSLIPGPATGVTHNSGNLERRSGAVRRTSSRLSQMRNSAPGPVDLSVSGSSGMSASAFDASSAHETSHSRASGDPNRHDTRATSSLSARSTRQQRRDTRMLSGSGIPSYLTEMHKGLPALYSLPPSQSPFDPTTGVTERSARERHARIADAEREAAQLPYRRIAPARTAWPAATATPLEVPRASTSTSRTGSSRRAQRGRTPAPNTSTSLPEASTSGAASTSLHPRRSSSPSTQAPVGHTPGADKDLADTEDYDYIQVDLEWYKNH